MRSRLLGKVGHRVAIFPREVGEPVGSGGVELDAEDLVLRLHLDVAVRVDAPLQVALASQSENEGGRLPAFAALKIQ